MACAGLALSLQLTPAQDLEAPEDKVKAAFLVNFTKLVSWPTNAFATSNAPLVLGVLGKNDPIGTQLARVIAGHSVHGHPLQFAQFPTVSKVTDCHVLFIGESERRKLDAIFAAVRARPILTVSDLKGFESRGIITLVTSNSSITLRINLEAARQANLQLSSRLIRLDRSLRPSAEKIPPPPAPERD